MLFLMVMVSPLKAHTGWADLVFSRELFELNHTRTTKAKNSIVHDVMDNFHFKNMQKFCTENFHISCACLGNFYDLFFHNICALY